MMKNFKNFLINEGNESIKEMIKNLIDTFFEQSIQECNDDIDKLKIKIRKLEQYRNKIDKNFELL